MRNKFDNELENLNNNITKMGALCESAIRQAMSCFIHDGDTTIEDVKQCEIKIDGFESEIESQCLKLILQQQPVAKDLRIVSAVLKMLTDLERIGDQAVDIAELSAYTKNTNLHLRQMAEYSIRMLTTAIDAFVNKDLELAKKTIALDNMVDDLFLTVRCDMIKELKEEVNSAEESLDILLIAKYLERIADHAVNVSEWVIFSITGLHKGENYDSNTRR